MHKVLLSLILIGFTADCTFSAAHAWGFKKRKVEDYGVGGDGTATDGSNKGGGMPVFRKAFSTDSGTASGDSVGVAEASANYEKHQSSSGKCALVQKICPEAEKNCRSLSKRKDINGEALDYTIQYLAENYKSLRDSSCAGGRAYGVNPKNGFQSGKFILNDLDTTLSNGRAQAHYVDLCTGEYHTYGVKKGTGGGNIDAGTKHTTLTGAFMTAAYRRTFYPFSPRRYRAAGLSDPKAVDLIGLNSSNNGTDGAKPMHESPSGWNTSWGCPSIDRSNLDLLNKIKGGNLVMNYKRGYMQRIGPGAKCTNGEGRGSGYSGPSSSSGGGQ